MTAVRRRSRRSGRYRDHVTIVAHGTNQDDFGDTVPAEDAVIRRCFCQIIPKRGGEQFHEGRYEGRAVYDVEIPEGTRPSVNHRIQWRRAGVDVVLEIVDVRDGNNAGRVFDLVAVEVVP